MDKSKLNISDTMSIIINSALEIITETDNILNSHINLYKNEEELCSIIKLYLENYNTDNLEVNENIGLIEHLNLEIELKMTNEKFLKGLITLIVLYRPVTNELRNERDNVLDTLLGLPFINIDETNDFINNFYSVSSKIIVTKAINPDLFKTRFNIGDTPSSELIIDLYNNLILVMNNEQVNEQDTIDELTSHFTM